MNDIKDLTGFTYSVDSIGRKMKDIKGLRPYVYRVDIENTIISNPDNHTVRKLSAMKGQYMDETAYENLLKLGDITVYEVYDQLVPEIPGELIHGMSIVHPGKVGKEYFMTKGHFHSILDTAELYHCLKGHGYMMLETLEGEFCAKELTPNAVLHVPGKWAHRSINVGEEDFVTFMIAPADSGHDYATIEKKGFRKLLIEENGKPEIIDNPKWKQNR